MKPWHAPIVALGALFLIGNLGAVFQSLGVFRVRAAFMILYTLGCAWAVAWWIAIDCRRRGISVPIDHGFFALYAWPVMLPVHLWRTRGARGCLVLAGMIGMFLATWLIALPLYYMLA